MIKFEYHNDTKYIVKLARLKTLVKKIDAKFDSCFSELVLVITNDRLIKKLNMLYNKKDKVTDVLSFGYPEYNLGEIFIDYQQSKRQAILYHHSTQAEIEFLFVHGMLHILGYDHKTNKDREEMDKQANQLLIK